MLPERMPSDLLHEGEGLKRKGPRARCLRCSAQSGAALSFVAALVLLKQSASPLGRMTEVVGFFKACKGAICSMDTASQGQPDSESENLYKCASCISGFLDAESLPLHV